MENQHSIDQLQEDQKACKNSLRKNTISSPHSLNKLTLGQGRLADIMAKDNYIITKLIVIQTMLLPHMEVIQKELSITLDLVNKYPHLSIIDSLVGLIGQLEIQIQVVKSAKSRRNQGFEVILSNHKTFFDKYQLTPTNPKP